jgi:CRISPR-associated protein Cas1
LPEIYRFQKRSQHPANDFFNAALNYAYGILYSQVEGALIKAGVDPFIGILHEPVHNKPVLVYDVFENFRYWADYVVINLCMQQVMFPEFFIKDDDAVLLEEDGKRILIQSFNDYMNEVVEIAGMERSRLVQIENYAFKLGDQINKTAN